MIKYEIKIIPKVQGFIMTEYKYKTVSKSELNEYLNNGWSLHRKKYFIITYLSDWWSNFNTNQKISIIGIIVASIVAVIIDNTGCN